MDSEPQNPKDQEPETRISARRLLVTFADTALKNLFSVSILFLFLVTIALFAPGGTRHVAQEISSIFLPINESQQNFSSSPYHIENAPAPVSVVPTEPQANKKPTKDDARLTQLEHEVSDLQRSLNSIHAALEDDPDRALSVPILRHDLENLKETTAQEITDTRTQADRLYDIVKWILGTTALGVLSLLLAGVVSRIFEKKNV